jgi:uncharacterized iron-regulated membrane protein
MGKSWIRRAVFQIHLWSGLILGVYVVVVCASGSAIVFRNDLYDWLEGAGRGFTYKALLYHWLAWLGRLHGSLLIGPNGMMANAIGGFLLAAMCVSGMVVWWPSPGNWARAMTVNMRVGWKRVNFDLHRAVGFWTFTILFMWGVTGGYFVFPDPFRTAIGWFTPVTPPVLVQYAPVPTTAPQSVSPRPRRRILTPGEKILRGFSYAHYGNFAGAGVKTLWVVLGLAPVILFPTAVLMWWNRVLRPALRRSP